jgi:hypothetical protein
MVRVGRQLLSSTPSTLYEKEGSDLDSGKSSWFYGGKEGVWAMADVANLSLVYER